MADEKIVEALFKDLRMEYGMALRYLTVINSIPAPLRAGVVPIMQTLASDCISHSSMVKKMLIEDGQKVDNYFDSFAPEFDVLDKALHSSFLLERKMAIDYGQLANNAVEAHKHKLFALSQWETLHMNEVKRAIDLVGKMGSSPDNLESSIHDRMEEVRVSRLSPSSVGGIVVMGRRDEEEEVSEARKKLAEILSGENNPAEQRKAAEEAISMIGFERIGIPADSILDSAAVDNIWNRKEYLGYCMECSSDRDMERPDGIVLANGLPAVKGKCSSCGSPMFAML